MYFSKFNKTMSKANEDTLGLPVMEVSGLSFFAIDNGRVYINDRVYDSNGITINTLSKLIEAGGGTVTNKTSSLLLSPCNIVANYSNVLYSSVSGSPRNLDDICYRYQDIDYSYSLLDEGTVVAGRFLSTGNLTTTVIKTSSRFRLFTTIDEYVGL